MLQQILVLCLIGAAFGYSAGERNEQPTTSRPGIPYVDYFDCSATTLSHNKHPWDCTRFIQCDESNNAFDMPCASCDDGPLCPGGGYLHFDGVPIGGNVPSCIWPADSTCVSGNGTTTEPSTDKPTTQIITTTTSGGGGGDRCNATDCEVEGDCHDYTFCRRIPSSNDKGPIYDIGEKVTESCGDEWYNPEESDGHQVAKCSVWGDLEEATRVRYERDCVLNPCKLEGACQRRYQEIWAPESGKTSPEDRECESGTVLDDVIRRCVSCSKATRRDPKTNSILSCAGQGDC